ncbi:hypothetical protein B0H66DRAFT_549620 [Apodospora peruviana]|uniref:dolichol kinase n=1 Tax=Apodospora peruviana TaxID=516989 RepID=A0AAE0IJE0_9PEZI|nr:hypothetical protein B0H66DRAFT_549620 [Apodospora peruviana]
MPEHLQPYIPEDGPGELRILSRSPHPYHRQHSELLEPSDRLVYRINAIGSGSGSASDLHSPKCSSPNSDSGTEADDEHFLKGLPAPKGRLHKGLRGGNESLSGSSTPLLSPDVLEEEGRKTTHLGPIKGGFFEQRDKRVVADRVRRRRELIRRTAEVLLLVFQGGVLATNHDVQPFLRLHGRGLVALGCVLSGLLAAYPPRLVYWAYRRGKPSKLIPVRIPSSFDPASFLYPPLTPVIVSLLVASNVDGVVPLNLVLSICALPRTLIPSAQYWETYSWSHWLLSCIPCFFDGNIPASELLGEHGLSPELLVLLYPLHQTLCQILLHLTTTSLLTAELQLLSVALINVLVLARSPQAVILKALLWGGGLSLIILCGQVIRWAISLARVPKWRFRRLPIQNKGVSTFRRLRNFWSLRRPARHDPMTDYDSHALSDSDHSEYSNADWGITRSTTVPLRTVFRVGSVSDTESIPSFILNKTPDVQFNLLEPQTRRHTLPSLDKTGGGNRSKTTTPSGRRKRSASFSVRAFFSLTQGQAAARKWIYSTYVLVCILATILAGVRKYVGRYALLGNEPIGWALGYMFGDLSWFRFRVVQANLEKWICLPTRFNDEDGLVKSCHAGWVQHVRQASFGEANTRLFLSASFLGVIAVGLAVVFQLSPIYEVDTRRKVFHFMMVAMFLPATFIDPAFVALALSIMLAIFLLLDLIRASQLPPLSKPIARFLTPYVDGRDLRGPVVISHIFLLIGCAIPLWLSMASLPRSGEGALKGWEVPTRDASMVSGIICVGLGDAAASLIGRRWGRHKWVWGGGKSIEGSIAFAGAVFAGLMVAHVWLRVGGWPLTAAMTTTTRGSIAAGGAGNMLANIWVAATSTVVIQKATLCAGMASITEAVLTGGNDNVVVPVVLWTCVKSMGV